MPPQNYLIFRDIYHGLGGKIRDSTAYTILQGLNRFSERNGPLALAEALESWADKIRKQVVEAEAKTAHRPGRGVMPDE